MNKAVIYIHGKGGNASEAEHYKPLFPDCEVIGFDYKSENPWEAKGEFTDFFDKLNREYDRISVIANSIGAFFLMSAALNVKIEKAFFISPVVDMEKLILNMMKWADVTEEDLQEKKEIGTQFGETLSWEYLCYVRNNPLEWNCPTHILYGENDSMTSYETVCSFAEKAGATLDVMQGGEHWFHTQEQMMYLDSWIKNAESAQESLC